MGIQYYLHEIKTNGRLYISGRVKYRGYTDLKRFIAILGDRGSSLTETDIKAVIELTVVSGANRCLLRDWFVSHG